MMFLNKADKDRILFSMNSVGALIPTYEIADDFKNKLSYFIKIERVEITKENYKTMLLNGDISLNPVQDIKTVSENVSKISIYSKTNNFNTYLTLNT